MDLGNVNSRLHTFNFYNDMFFQIADSQDGDPPGVQIIAMNTEQDIHIINGETVELMLPAESDVGNIVTIETVQTEEVA